MPRKITLQDMHQDPVLKKLTIGLILCGVALILDVALSFSPMFWYHRYDVIPAGSINLGTLGGRHLSLDTSKLTQLAGQIDTDITEYGLGVSDSGSKLTKGLGELGGGGGYDLGNKLIKGLGGGGYDLGSKVMKGLEGLGGGGGGGSDLGSELMKGLGGGGGREEVTTSIGLWQACSYKAIADTDPVKNCLRNDDKIFFLQGCMYIVYIFNTYIYFMHAFLHSQRKIIRIK